MDTANKELKRKKKSQKKPRNLKKSHKLYAAGYETSTNHQLTSKVHHCIHW